MRLKRNLHRRRQLSSLTSSEGQRFVTISSRNIAWTSRRVLVDVDSPPSASLQQSDASRCVTRTDASQSPSTLTASVSCSRSRHASLTSSGRRSRARSALVESRRPKPASSEVDTVEMTVKDGVAEAMQNAAPVAAEAPLVSSESTVADTDMQLPIQKTVVICDDSELNRRCLLRSFEKAIPAGLNWTYIQFETAEDMCVFVRGAPRGIRPRRQSMLRNVDDTTNYIVCLDENMQVRHRLASSSMRVATAMQSRGGVMTGTDAVHWLVNALKFKGWIISTSGDPNAGQFHLDSGAHLAWGTFISKVRKKVRMLLAGKPLPRVKQMRADIRRIARLALSNG